MTGDEPVFVLLLFTQSFGHYQALVRSRLVLYCFTQTTSTFVTWTSKTNLGIWGLNHLYFIVCYLSKNKIKFCTKI